MTRRLLTSWLAARTPSRRPRLGVEYLEDRVVPDGTLPPDLVVGRTLSAYTASAVPNRTLDITYTVYNQRQEELTGVLLTTTLQPGVTVATASAVPDRSGQDLAWSLGTVRGYDRASVTVTVTLPQSLTLQIDSGARAFATLNAGAVTADTPAATLANRTIAPELLASTVDANTADPFVQEQAAKLRYDPQSIVQYLSTDVGYESYTGSLRGARGTLWSEAGNSLDEASLGVALLRASGVPARYAHGTLSDPLSRQLVLTMFPDSFQTIGLLPAGTPTADPANDPKLLGETRDHYWLQLDTGGGFVDADTSGLPGSGLGAAFTTAAETFAEVPDAARHKVRVTLDAETYSSAGALFGFGDGRSTATVLDQTFTSAELVGRPLTVGHFVTQSALGFVFTAQTTTYSPYLLVGDVAESPTLDRVIRGQDYQDIQTNFPLGSQVLTGLFLRATLTGPDGPAETHERALVDRIGYAARTGFATSSVSIDPDAPPAVTEMDAFTLFAVPGAWNPRPSPRLEAGLADDAARVAAATAADGQLADEGLVYAIGASIGTTRLLGDNFLAQSDDRSDRLEAAANVAAYPDRPRLVLASGRVRGSEDPATVRYETALDLRRDGVRAVAPPGQAADAPFTFAVARGLFETVVEQSTLADAAGPGREVASAGTVFGKARAAGLPVVYVTADTLAGLDPLTISAEAKARITAAVRAGREVLVPAAPVPVNGQPMTAWLEHDPATGETIDTTEDGGHNAIVGYVAILTLVAGTGIIVALRRYGGGLLGGVAGLYLSAVYRLNQVSAFADSLKPPGSPPPPPGQQTPEQQLQDQKKKLVDDFGWFFDDEGKKAFSAALYGTVLRLTEQDPPVTPHLIGLASPPPPAVPAIATTPAPATLAAGRVTGTTAVGGLTLSGRLAASWRSAGATGLTASALTATATVTAGGGPIGSGVVGLAAGVFSLAVGPGADFAVTGTGRLAPYATAGDGLTVAADWNDFAATLTGGVTLTVTTDGLTLDGVRLPAGTYTITTNSAAITGRGPTSSPTFAGSFAVTVTDGIVTVGPGAGTLSVGGAGLDPAASTTLGGYTGTIGVTDGGTADAVALDGTAATVLRVTTTPAAPTADQNTPVVIGVAVGTNLAGDYYVSAEPPPGWAVAVGADGAVTVTPAPGTQDGTHPVRIVARSKANTFLAVQTTVMVAVTPTAPAVALEVTPDPIFTVPLGPAELPTAFQGSVRNLGPTADTFTVTGSGLPAGFTLAGTEPDVTVPAGKTGVLGLYLQPQLGTLLPAPGTVLTFDVTATSTTDPTVTQTRTVTFTMPAVHAVVVTATPAAVTTTPGTPATVTLTFANVGNVDEPGVGLTATATAGLTVAGLIVPPLAVGQTAAVTLTLTPDAAVPLNTALAATLTAAYGPLPQTLVVRVAVAVPGAAAIGTAAEAAGRLGNPDLADRLDDLSTALTTLVQTPADPVARGQAVAGIDAINRLLAADPFLAAVVPALTADAALLAAATTSPAVQAAVVALGDTLGDLGTTLADAVDHRFTLEFEQNSAVGRPLVPTTYRLIIRNTGAVTTTYDLAVTGLPAGVTAALAEPSVTLAPGQVTVVGLTVTSTSPDELSPFTFLVTATAEGAPTVTRTVTGSFTARDALVQVTSVTATPTFTDPGGVVAVSARILNAVNARQEALVSFTLTDAGGTVVFTSAPVPVTLTVLTTLTTVDLGTVDTTGFAVGDYTIGVTVADAAGTPIPGATGTGHLLVGSPVSATLTVGPETLPPGTGTVTNTLVVASQAWLVGPLGVVSLTNLPGAGGVVKNGHYVYASGTTGIQVFDITDPANPQLIRTFGSSATTLKIRGDKLYALNWSGASLLIYSLTDPENPQLLGTAKYNDVDGIPYALTWHMVVTDTHVFASLWRTVQLIGNPQDIKFQTGDVIAIDVTNPTAPVFVSAMLNTYGTTNDGIGQFLNADNNGGDGNLWEIVQVDANTLLVAGSTAKGDDTQSGSGVVHVIDISDPAQMAIVRTLTIPGTVQAAGLSIQGNLAFVTGSQGGWNDPAPPNDADFTGNLVLATLNISDPRNPVLIHSEVQDRSSVGPYSLHTIPLGNGLFAFSSQGNSQEESALFVVDASNPTNLITSQTTIPAINAFGDLEGAGNYLYSTSPSGLIIYQIDAPDAIPATARVTVPTGDGVTVVPGSFSLTPTRTSPAADGTTYEWDLSLGSTRTITWQSTVTNVQPGRSRTVATGGSVSFTSEGTPGEVALADLTVAGVQIIGIVPATPTAAPGSAATYQVTLVNPTATAVTYTLAVQGVPAGWVGLPASVAVPANGTVDVALTLTPAVVEALADYGFTVTATAGGATGSAPATLTVAGVAPPTDAAAHGVVVGLTPAAVTVGQGTAGRYVVRVTNTGSATETFTLSAVLPAGVVGVFDRASVEVPPGAGNFREVTLTVTPAAGTAAGVLPVSVTATSATAAGTAAGSLTVAAAGVTVTLDRAAGAPGDTFTATVTNTGTAADTFDLSAGGPAGLVAALGVAAVTLQPGESRAVTVTTGAAAFAVQGPLNLMVAARSQAAPQVAAGDDATLMVPPTAGLTAALDPLAQTLPAPGPADFVLTVNNTGNTEGEYTATITGTTGPVTAVLIGLDGLPTQSIALFRLPGLTTGAIRLRANLTVDGTGTVTIVVRSRTDPTRTATVTAAVGTPVPVVPPIDPPVIPPVVPIEPPIDPIRRRLYAVGAGPGGAPRVQVYDAATDARLFDFFAYDSSLRGGVSVATADVTGDGVEDVVTGAGFGGGSHVKVFDGESGDLVASWFAYEGTFFGGVWVAAADLDGDGTAEVVTGAGVGGGPVVKVWSVAGGVPTLARSFLAFDADSRSGATVAVGRGADGRAVIAAGSGPGSDSRVRTFDALTGTMRSDVAAFEPGFTGGVYLAAGDVYGTGAGTQFLVGPGSGGGPRLRVLDSAGEVVADLFAAADGLRNGLTVAALDRPGGSAAVLVGAGAGAFRGELADGRLGDLDRVGLFEPGFDGGVFVG